MHLNEYASRQCLSRFGIPTVAASASDSPEAAAVIAHFFLGIYADRGNSIVMVASADGASSAGRGRFVSETINPFLGVLEFQARNLANGINLSRDSWSAFIAITQNLYHCLVSCDAVRAEIAPLGLLPDGSLLALGGDLTLDDNALFRQPDLVASSVPEADQGSEALARAAGVSFVRLGGTVACAANGAGLGLATLDLLSRNGCAAACFLDMSRVHRTSISAAFNLILPGAVCGLFNIFADRDSCVEVAQEFQAALTETPPTVPLIIRLAGREAEHGLAALDVLNIPNVVITAELSEAVRLVASATKGYTDVDLSR